MARQHDSHVNVIITVACDQCSATLPLCAQVHAANSAHESEMETLSENAGQKTNQNQFASTPIPVFEKKSGQKIASLQPSERDPRILHSELRKCATKLELGVGDGAPALV